MQIFEGLPVYNAVLDDAEGLSFISIVTEPAIQHNFIAFDKNERISLSFDDEKRIVFGPVLIPDQLIYRRNENKEFYITFSKETIRALMEKFMRDKELSINLQHEYATDNATIIESFIIDRELGIVPKHFSTLPDGTWCCAMKIHSDKLWQLIKEGKLNGYSIEGFLSLVEMPEEIKQSSQNKSNIFMNKKSLKMLLKSLLTSLGAVNTDKGQLLWDGDEDLVAGKEVFIEGEDDYIAPEDGDYTTADGKVIKVVDGKIAEIIDPAAEVAPEEVETEMSEVTEETVAEELAEETVENPTNEGEETDTEAIVKIREELNEAYRRIDELTRELQELKDTVAKLAEAPVEMSAIETVIAEETDKVSGFAALRKNRK